jgi:CHRD domain-containing protein
MRRLLVVLVLVIAGLTTASVAGAATSTTFVAVLSPVAGCPTNGRGVAIVTVTKEGTVQYRLIVANLENVTAAHIHRTTGTVSTAGAVAFLYEAASPVDVHDRVVLASGTITATVEPDLTVEELAAALLGGTSFYVNVHTTECPSGALAGDLLLQGTA